MVRTKDRDMVACATKQSRINNVGAVVLWWCAMVVDSPEFVRHFLEDKQEAFSHRVTSHSERCILHASI